MANVNSYINYCLPYKWIDEIKAIKGKSGDQLHDFLTEGQLLDQLEKMGRYCSGLLESMNLGGPAVCLFIIFFLRCPSSQWSPGNT